MKRSWEFFTRVVSTDATHCQSVWQWRCRCAYGADESPHFTSLPECVADARRHGFSGDKPEVSVMLVFEGPCRTSPDEYRRCEAHLEASRAVLLRRSG